MQPDITTKIAGSIALLLVSSSFLYGCAAPCGIDQDCPSDQFCSEEETCARECTDDVDCEGLEVCNSRGKCTISLRPRVEFVSPPAGSEVEDVFDIELDVTFRASTLVVSFERDPSDTNARCAPFAPIEITLTGDLSQEVTQRVVIPNIKSLGRTFSFRTVATANLLLSSATRGFSSASVFGAAFEPSFELGGAAFQSPIAGIIRENQLSTPLAAVFSPQAGVVTAWVEPERGDPSPRVLLAQNAASIEDILVPLARGRQTVWIETERQGEITRCGSGVTVSPLTPSRGLEIGLSFESESDAELDIWIFAEREGYPAEVCTVENPRALCRDGAQSNPFRPRGEETLSIDLAPGIYGIAIAPSIISEPVSARVRLSSDGAHLQWLGPRRVFAEDGEVWLAGRIYVLDGTVSIESLEEMVVGLPSGNVSDW